MTKTTFTTFALISLVLGGCGSAQLVGQSAHGGKVALSGAYMESVADARMLMLESCGGQRFSYVGGEGELEFRCASGQPDGDLAAPAFASQRNGSTTVAAR